ncbi:hypothetical protein [Limnobaculum xujianqingii]|uniref:hypothetical protein n=1 Tax=Limnobaculum xujianqingii TaxID=2738837 RepID=UPI00112A6E0A|nr:hypothetical protein [Limnobaculum xujianqingii]
MTLDIAFQLVLGLACFFGGIWIKRLQDDIKSLQSEIKEIKDKYQPRLEADRDFSVLKDLITDIKQRIERIDNKLDRKADK